MAKEPMEKRLDALEERLDKVAQARAPKPREQSEVTQAQAGWRMVTELVVGILLGFGIGYGLDSLLGTTPWLMIVFLGFGFAAGIKTMMRTAKEVQANTAPEGTGPQGKEEMYDDD